MTPTILLAAGDDPAKGLSIFNPASPGTHSTVGLAILIFAITGLIFVIVEGVLFYSFATLSAEGFRPDHGAAASLRQPADRNRLDRGRPF